MTEFPAQSGILAVDFGGTQLRSGWFVPDEGGLTLSNREITLSHVEQGQTAVLKRIVETARIVVPTGAAIQAIGVAAPGPLDVKHGLIRHARTLPGWQGVPLAATLREAFGSAPTFIQNDASLGALAEFHQGAGQGCDPMLYLTISTGIGGGAVIGGKLFTGADGLAIEPGHQRFTLPDGRVKNLEQLASGTAIGRRAVKRLYAEDQYSTLREIETIDGKAVGNAAVAGDGLALDVVREAGEWLGLGLVNLIHLFNPQAIVLGGSVTQLGDLLLDPAREVIQRELLDAQFYRDGLIRIAALRENVCLVGAAYYAAQSLDNEPGRPNGSP